MHSIACVHCDLILTNWDTGGLQRQCLSHAIEWPSANRCAFIYWKRAGSKVSHITFDSRSSIRHPIQFTLPTYTTPRSLNVILLMKTRNGLCISFYVLRYGYSAYPHYIYKEMYNRTRRRGLSDRLLVPKIVGHGRRNVWEVGWRPSSRPTDRGQRTEVQDPSRESDWRVMYQRLQTFIIGTYRVNVRIARRHESVFGAFDMRIYAKEEPTRIVRW